MAFPFSLPFLSGGISMKTKLIAILALLCALCLALTGCDASQDARTGGHRGAEGG